jgi:hypothetical protein
MIPRTLDVAKVCDRRPGAFATWQRTRNHDKQPLGVFEQELFQSLTLLLAQARLAAPPAFRSADLPPTTASKNAVTNECGLSGVESVCGTNSVPMKHG